MCIFSFNILQIYGEFKGLLSINFEYAVKHLSNFGGVHGHIFIVLYNIFIGRIQM